MQILTFNMEGPLQAWGTTSKYVTRATERFPTKSGVIGMIANALGITREMESQLAQSGLLDIEIVFREDRQGSVLKDFHTVHHTKNADAQLSDRYYISDGKFLVGITHPDEAKLTAWEQALKHPKNALFLGRRSCVPNPILPSLENFPSWQEFLEQTPPLDARNKNAHLRALIEVKPHTPGYRLQDIPTSFQTRTYRTRQVQVVQIPNPALPSTPEHDPFDLTDDQI